MQNTKLIELLITLNGKEWTRLREYVDSPYFNKRQEVSDLLNYLYERKEALSSFPIEKEAMHEVLFPGTRYDEKQLAYLFNYLLRLTEDYLAQEEIEKDYFVVHRAKLEQLLERRLDKHFNFQFNKLQKQVKNDEQRSDVYWRNRFYLAEIESQIYTNKRQRQFNNALQELSDYLDDYYIYEKLRYGCAMVTLEGIGSSKFHIGFIDEIRQYLSQKEEIDFHIQIYLQLFDCLTQPEAYKEYFILKKLITENGAQLSQGELREILVAAINICARNIRKGRSEFYQEALDLYLAGIQNKALFTNGSLTHWTFNNVVKLGLRLQKHEWLKKFINDYSVYLPPRMREDTMNFSLAELAFNQKDYDTVLERVRQIKYTDPQFYLGARIMLLKAFYALGNIDTLSSNLASFIMFLRRNKKISADYKKTLLNFCSLLHLILRSKPGKKEKVIHKIQETKQKIEGPWLLEIAEEML